MTGLVYLSHGSVESGYTLNDRGYACLAGFQPYPNGSIFQLVMCWHLWQISSINSPEPALSFIPAPCTSFPATLKETPVMPPFRALSCQCSAAMGSWCLRSPGYIRTRQGYFNLYLYGIRSRPVVSPPPRCHAGEHQTTGHVVKSCIPSLESCKDPNSTSPRCLPRPLEKPVSKKVSGIGPPSLQTALGPC
jgi:hypothetical protein